MASEGEEEYDPSRPFVSAPSPQPSASNQARLPPPPPTLVPTNGRPLSSAGLHPPPPPTLPVQAPFDPSRGGPPPPPTLFGGSSPLPGGGFPPPPPFLARGGQNPPHPPFPPTMPPASFSSSQASTSTAKDPLDIYINPPKPPTIFLPPKVGLEISHIPKQRVMKSKPLKSKASGGLGDGTIQDTLRKALYQDEKYTLHDPVWKVVAGKMERVHFIETSETNLPITKLIATKKVDAVAMHDRLLEKSPAAIYYSDGSFKKGWAWGAAVEWVRQPGQPGHVGRKLREELGMCDPTDAELGGMRKALESFASAGRLEREELLIFSDSQAAITMLDSGIRYQSQLFISTLERTLTLHPNVKVSIVWIPGHVGIAGNEFADRTAVAGSTTTVLARTKRKLPGAADSAEEQGPSDMPIVLGRTTFRTEVGADGENVEVEVETPKDDSLTFGEGSLFVSGFPDDATSADLAVLFGQFGSLVSIDIMSIPPLEERFAIVSFVDPTVISEAIEWLDDKPVSLPSKYAETRDCEVWKGWQGTLRIAQNEVGRLVPTAIALIYPELPEWARTGHSPSDDEEEMAEAAPVAPFKDDFVVDSKPTSGQLDRAQAAFGSGAAPKPMDQMTPSEKFLLNVEVFGPGPGYLQGGRQTSRPPQRKAPYPPPGVNGRPPVATTSLSPNYPIQALPSPAIHAPSPHAPHQPIPTPQPFREPSAPLPPPAPIHPSPFALPTTIAGMTRLVVDLKAQEILLDEQHARLSIVLRDPADWSLAVDHLGRTMLREQEALENARRIRVQAEDEVGEWEAVLQRNDVGIEERRGFVLDVLDVLDEGVMGKGELVHTLRNNISAKSLGLASRMHALPPTTKTVVHSFESLFSTLHNAIEDQRIEIDEAERRTSVLRTLVEIRREARGRWRERREEIDMVVDELMRPAPPPPPPMKPEPMWDERPDMGRGGPPPPGRDGGYYPPPPPPASGDFRYRDVDPREMDHRRR